MNHHCPPRTRHGAGTGRTLESGARTRNLGSNPQPPPCGAAALAPAAVRAPGRQGAPWPQARPRDPSARPGRSPGTASALRPGPAQPRRAAPLPSAPPRCGWGPRRCCWPARCGSRSGPTPSSCSSAGGDTAKGAASRVRRRGAGGRLRLGAAAASPQGRAGPRGAEGPPQDGGAGPVRAGQGAARLGAGLELGGPGMQAPPAGLSPFCRSRRFPSGV